MPKLPKDDRTSRNRLRPDGLGQQPQPTTKMSGTPRPTEQELEEAFVKVTFQDEREDWNKDPLYPYWTEKSRCTKPSPLVHPCVYRYTQPLRLGVNHWSMRE